MLKELVYSRCKKRSDICNAWLATSVNINTCKIPFDPIIFKIEFDWVGKSVSVVSKSNYLNHQSIQLINII